MTLGRGKSWPLLPLSPAFVAVFGLAIALFVGATGIVHLERNAARAAERTAALLVESVARRTSAISPSERLNLLLHVAKETGAELVLADGSGSVQANASLHYLDPATLKSVIASAQGAIMTPYGKAFFAVSPLTPGSTNPVLVAFVRAHEATDDTALLVQKLFAFTILLVATGAFAAFVVSRDIQRDVTFITNRVRTMVQERTAPAGEPIPPRTLDEIGSLALAFNELVFRFDAAQKTYHQDLLRAESANRDRALFLAAISHELRSPLNAILGFAEVLQAEVDGPLSPAARQDVEQIRASGAHLLELITDILEFSAIESGQLTLNYERVDASAIAEEVVREATGTLTERPLQIHLDVPPAAPLEADATRVRQILTNLVANAIKFTERGEVAVAVHQNEAYVTVSVRDTGPGISPRELPLIFEEYRQASGERKKKRGAGLGLAIARRLAILHGGTIQVESEVGRGSIFHVILPKGRRGSQVGPSTEGAS